MGKDLLQKVIDETKIGNKQFGLLTEEQTKFITGNLIVEKNSLHVFRQFSPMRDAMEYTLIYRDADGKKQRVDFDVEIPDMEMVDESDLEKFISVIAKAVLRSHIIRDRWEASA